MKRFFFIVILTAVSLSCFLWYSCTKKEINGSIYGIVTDFATGEPVGNVNVKLRPSGETTLTGSDGTYEFSDLGADKYSLFLSKAEYGDIDDDYVIDLEAGKTFRRDVQMRKRIASLQITDMAGNPLDTLDFGSEESVTVKTFNLFNDGTESLSCTATHDCEWIGNVSGLENQIQPGQTVPVTVRINRAAMDDGVNTTFLYITSGNGSNEIVVKATFLGTAAITTQNASNVTANTATLGGIITDDGGRQVLERGICYGTSQTPDINGDHTQDGSGTGEFSHNITGLSSATTYYARAYATNRNGTYYASNIVSFTTTDGLPTVTTATITAVTATTARSGGNVTNSGGFNVTERGICWNLIGSPDISDYHTTNGNGNGSFVSNMTGLSVGTTYHVRAYATNSHGTSYGNEVTFSTSDGSVTMSIAAATNITSSSASCSVTINNDGGSTITERGICWGTAQYPTTAGSKSAAGTGTGTFTAYMSSLSPSTTYYVRGYAVNAVGTSYSNQISFTTNDGLPAVTTGSVSSVTANSAVCSGNVNSDGGYAVTAKGFCWSTSQYPTVTDAHSNNGSGIGSFNGGLSNLRVSTTYYVRSYATNNVGTAYGAEVCFTTDNGLPTVTTTSVTKNGNNIVSGGNITSDGGFTITARGVCYGQYPQPDLSATYSHTRDGINSGYYSSIISGTFTGTLYVRAYATNANGTSYGNEIVVDVDYLNLPTFIFGGRTYKVLPAPSGTVSDISSARLYCNTLTNYGHSDWRMPTIDELYQMYLDRNNIGGFGTSTYWSTTRDETRSSSSNYYYTVDFRTGVIGSSSPLNGQLYIRPIRVDQ
ncbi:MAG: carboxypeptidase regulatory-like domain-containing protein [Bacteroidales bacterium]|nr:carboxypeptidase regulatory-like domain-containing protein [Bacteroidales bacterium]